MSCYLLDFGYFKDMWKCKPKTCIYKNIAPIKNICLKASIIQKSKNHVIIFCLKYDLYWEKIMYSIIEYSIS